METIAYFFFGVGGLVVIISLVINWVTRRSGTTPSSPSGRVSRSSGGFWLAFGKLLWRLGIWLLIAMILLPMGTCSLVTFFSVNEELRRSKEGPQMPRGQVMVERIATPDDWSEPVLVNKAIFSGQKVTPEAHVVIEVSSQYGDYPTGIYSVEEYDWPPLTRGPHVGNDAVKIRYKTKRTAEFPMAERTSVLVYIKQ